MKEFADGHPTMAIGPSLPPHLQPTSTSSDDDDEDGQSIGPALPPHLQARRAAANSPSVGPRLPASAPPPPAAELDSEDDDDDDFVVGPMPVPEGAPDDQEDALREFEDRQHRWAKIREVRSFPFALFF